MIFVATKKGRTPKIIPPFYSAAVGSEIQDKHPGSATLANSTVSQEKKTVFNVFCTTYLALASCLHLG